MTDDGGLDDAEPRRTRVGWGKRAIIAAAAVFALAVAGLVLLSWAVDSLDSGMATNEDIITDKSELSITRTRLDEVMQALTSLPEYAGTDASPAEQGPCGTDSGDLFQPYAVRAWSVAGGSPAEIAQITGDDLSKLGWTVSAAEPVRPS